MSSPRVVTADQQKASIEQGEEIPYQNATSSGATAVDQKISGIGNFEQLLSLGASDQEPDANDAHIVNIVDWLFQYAFQQRASDIHIEPRREQGSVRFRIDGVLHTVYQLPISVMTAMVLL